ncbi:MAG: hypothetical protein ACKVPJ_04960 [Chitinophagales bacterium]
MQLKLIQTCFVLFLLSFNVFSQSGWVKEKNEWYINSTLQYAASNNYYNTDGILITTNTYTSAGLYFYGELGITDYLTLISSIPAVKFQKFEGTTTTAGFGDVLLGGKIGVLKNKFPLSVGIYAEIPSGTSELFAQVIENPIEQINLPSGDGEFNLRTEIALSHSFFPKPFYASVYAGYNFRTMFDNTMFHDQIYNGAEVGYEFMKKFWLIAKLNTQITLQDETLSGIDFTRGEGTEFSKYQVSILFPSTTKWSLSFFYTGYMNFPVTLKNVYAAGNFGLSFSLKK